MKCPFNLSFARIFHCIFFIFHLHLFSLCQFPTRLPRHCQLLLLFHRVYPLFLLFQPQRDDILKWLRINLAERNLQATPWYLEKILQIYEMLLVRHGLMIVGGSMGGKTTAYQVRERVKSQLNGAELIIQQMAESNCRCSH